MQRVKSASKQAEIIYMYGVYRFTTCVVNSISLKDFYATSCDNDKNIPMNTWQTMTRFVAGTMSSFVAKINLGYAPSSSF
jgi:hypothetical protein